MKIIIEEEDRKITIELPEDLELYLLMNEIQGIVGMMGYSFEAITDYWNDFEHERHSWIFNYDARLRNGSITPKEILYHENLRRKKPIKMSTVTRAINGAGFSLK